LPFEWLNVAGNWLWEPAEKYSIMIHIVKNTAVVNDKGKRSTNDIGDYADKAQNGTHRECIALVAHSHRLKCQISRRKKMGKYL